MLLSFKLCCIEFFCIFIFIRGFYTRSCTRKFKAPSSQSRINSITSKRYAGQSEKKIQYALRVYRQWRDDRLTSSPEKCIELCDLNNNIGKFSRRDLCDTLCLFANEIIRVDNKDFPPKSVRGFIYNIQMHLRKKKIGWRLLDPVQFLDLRNTIDNIMKERTAKGLGKENPSLPISFAMEELLWQKGILGESNPIQLMHTVCYLLGLHCALRGRGEHYCLRRHGCDSQFDFILDEDGVECLRYTEDPLQKANQGGINDDGKQKSKIVYIYADPNTDRDPLRLYKKYVTLQPKKSYTCKSFYLRPLRNVTPTCWYGDQSYGKTKVGSIVKEICSQAKFKGKFTNHSLRRTAATRMFHAKIEEKIVKEITGHSSDCVRMYMKTCDALKRDASLAIYGKSSRRLVTCTVSKPGEVEVPANVNHISQSIVEDQKSYLDISQNVSGKSRLYPGLPKVQCYANHPNSGITRMCQIVQKKVNDRVGYDVNAKEYPRQFCTTETQTENNSTGVDAECQTDLPCNCSQQKNKDNSVRVSDGNISVDINFNLNLKK